ncbi:MAG: IS66 family transposase, partial [Hydrogenophilus sp.]|nr:IS66 family transposase [Hydrogenophilus sp.]
MRREQIEKLPDDPAVLRAALLRTADELRVANQQIDLLKHQILLLKRWRYGSSSERVQSGYVQGVFEFMQGEAADSGPMEVEEEDLPEPRAERVERKKSGGRKELPKELPREQVIHEVPEGERFCKCCGKPMEPIGKEVSESIELIPMVAKVVEHVRVKYACLGCQEGVKTAEMPVKPIEKARPGATLLATVVDWKYGRHLPLFRQVEMLQKAGLPTTRGQLCGWVGHVAERLRPIWELMKGKVLLSRKIHTDDTPVRVLDPGKGKTRTGRFWVYLWDGENPHAVFDYTPSRSRDGPARFLSGYKGYLQADAFAGYDALYAGEQIVEVACWAHARRKYYEALATDRQAVGMLRLISALYVVEEMGRGQAPETRLKLRQELSRHVLDRMLLWMDARRNNVLPKSPLGQAISYTRSNWKALNRFVEDPILSLDNNAAENAVRCVALGRKNWLFVGNDEAGERAAILYSILASCRLNGVDPWEYLADVLIRVSTHPSSRADELLPANWKRAVSYTHL